MASEPTSPWRPDWAVPPGDILLEALEERGMSQSELARRTDRPIKTINEIIKGKAAITPETAIQFELVLGISARFWNGLESTFRDHLAREQARQQLEGSTAWLDGFPLKDLFRRKLIPRHSDKADTVSGSCPSFVLAAPRRGTDIGSTHRPRTDRQRRSWLRQKPLPRGYAGARSRRQR